MKSDDEIRQMIREFRENYESIEYCYVCPFLQITPYTEYKRHLCSCCSHIFGIMPPIPDAVLTHRPHYSYYRTKHKNNLCPCSLYGLEYTSEKVAIFMGEL